MVGVVKGREKERSGAGWIGRVAAEMWIHEVVCIIKCKLHGKRFHVCRYVVTKQEWMQNASILYHADIML